MGAERSGCSRMRIGLIDVDGHNFPNIPLMKLAAWHKQHGDTVEWYEPLFSGHMDRVYMSKVFGFTEDYPYFVDADEVIRGGSGYCIELTEGRERYIKERDKELPPEVEHIYPDYSIYPRLTHKDKEMSFSMRPLHKRKSLYYGCKVRNRAAIIFWEDKHMRKNLTEIVFILDRSGSMSGLERDTIGGFNSMIEQQKKAEGEALISTVLFDNVSEVLHDRVNVKDIRPMTDRDYTVRGCTALLDAIGGAIHHIGNVHKYARPEDVPEHTMFVITTDGMENASRRYNSEKVKQMIERQKAKYGWEFLFLGANIDAVETASQFGIGADRAVNYQCDSEGTALNYEVVSEAISSVRCSAPLSADWKKRIDEDYKKRGGCKHK